MVKKLEHPVLAILNFFWFFLYQNGLKKFEMPNFGCSDFLPVFLANFGQNWVFQIFSNHLGTKRLGVIWNNQNWAFQFSSNHFGTKSVRFTLGRS